jgi:hypothetical protein
MASLPGGIQECRDADGGHLDKCYFQMLVVTANFSTASATCMCVYIYTLTDRTFSYIRHFKCCQVLLPQPVEGDIGNVFTKK